MAENKAIATIGKDAYRTSIETSGHTILADEPAEKGGTNLGPTPESLMRSALASCTAITIRMYADRKKWNVGQIQVTVSSEKKEYKTVFTCAVAVTGELNQEQRSRLLEIAHACPVHKILANPIEVDTTIS